MHLKIPNLLTIGRIIVVPIFVVTFFLPGMYGDLIPFFLFVGASFTDFLDGLLARVLKAESKLGELLDPIADKILVCAALVLLVMNETIKNYEVVAAIIILTREILISSLREFLAKISISMPVTNLAKFKTFLLIALPRPRSTSLLQSCYFQQHSLSSLVHTLLFRVCLHGFIFFIKGCPHWSSLK